MRSLELHITDIQASCSLTQPRRSKAANASKPVDEWKEKSRFYMRFSTNFGEGCMFFKV